MRTLLLALFCTTQLLSQLPPRPEPAEFVNDFANMLSEEEERSIEQLLLQHDRQTSSQIVFVLVNNYHKSFNNIEAYANQLANKWGIGQKGQDNGVLVVIARDLRLIRIEVGYGLEAQIPDLTAKNIIDYDMQPYFKQEKYALGIRTAAQSLIEASKGFVDKRPAANLLNKIFLIYFPYLLLSLSIIAYLGSLQRRIDAPRFTIFVFGFLIILFFIVGQQNFTHFVFSQYDSFVNYFIGLMLLLQLGAFFNIWTLLSTKRSRRFWLLHGLLLTLPVIACWLEFYLLWNSALSTLWTSLFTYMTLFSFIFLFIAACHGIFNWSDFDKTYHNSSKLESLAKQYLPDDLTAFLYKYKRKLARTPLFFYSSLKRYNFELKFPEKQLKKRPDYSLIQHQQTLHTHQDKFITEHNNYLKNRLKETLSFFKERLNNNQIDALAKSKLKIEIDYFNTLLDPNKKETQFMRLYQEIVAAIDPKKWEQIAREDKYPDRILAQWQKFWKEFAEPDFITNTATFEQEQKRFLKRFEELQKSTKPLNHIPLERKRIELEKSGNLANQLYNPVAIQKLVKEIEEQIAFYKKHAQRVLTDKEQQSLSKLFQHIDRVIEQPEETLGYNLAFLKSKVSQARNWDWEQYEKTYTMKSINSTQWAVNDLIKRIDKTNSTELMLELHEKYMKYLLNFPSKLFKFIPKKRNVSYSSRKKKTYGSSYSSSGSYGSSFGGGSSYSDYSDSSFGGGSFGGGGATGGW